MTSGYQARQAKEQANADLHRAAFDPLQDKVKGRDYADLNGIRDALDRGANVNAVNDRGKTALHMTQSAHAAKMLLEAGADPLALDNDGLLPSQARLMSTGQITHKGNGVDWIVEVAAKERQAQQKAPEQVQTQAPFAGVSADAKPQYLLHEAKNWREAEKLIATGADVNERNEQGQTPLMHQLSRVADWQDWDPDQETEIDLGQDWIAKNVHKLDHELVQGMLNAGADPTIADHHGNTPLHCEGIDFKTVDMLQAHGADINARNELGETPLHAQANNWELDVKGLAGRGADESINAQDSHGRTPLMVYLEKLGGGYLNEEGVKDYFSVGADAQAVDHAGQSVLDYTEIGGVGRGVVQNEIATQQKGLPTNEHQQLFDTFKEQVTAPAQQREPTPLEQAQQARSPSLAAAAVSQKVELPDFRKQEAQARDPSALSQKVSLPDFRKEPERDQQKGARFVELPLPQRGQAHEPTAGEAFNAETTRRASARMAPSLGQATIAAGLAPAPVQEQEGQGQQGKGQGGRDRPSDPSYYTQFSQSVSLPKRDEQSAEKQAARRAVDRERGRGLGGRGI